MEPLWLNLGQKKALKSNERIMYFKEFTGEIGFRVESTTKGFPYVWVTARIRHSASFINETSIEGFDAHEAFSEERIGVFYPGEGLRECSAYEWMVRDLCVAALNGHITNEGLRSFAHGILLWKVSTDKVFRKQMQKWCWREKDLIPDASVYGPIMSRSEV